MSLYYFDLHECGLVNPDTDGIEARDLEHVREIAVTSARDIMSAEIAAGRLCLSCHIDVLDEARQPVMRILFRDAVTITGL